MRAKCDDALGTCTCNESLTTIITVVVFVIKIITQMVVDYGTEEQRASSQFVVTKHWDSVYS